jgi:hypothetical protein
MPHSARDQPRRPVQVVSLSITGFGVCARVDGRTGREAWRILARRHPRLTKAVVCYALLLVGLAVLGIQHLF